MLIILAISTQILECFCPKLFTMFQGRFSLALLSISQVAADVKPLSLAIRNFALDDNVAANRGIQVQLGGQWLGMRFSTVWNNTL
jgi:hypothetical protein